VPTARGRRAQALDGHDDPQPYVSTVSIASAPHLLDHLARLGCGAVTVLLTPEMRRAGDVEVGWGHRYSITSSVGASSEGEVVRSSAFAVFKLMIRSNSRGSQKTISPGFVPFRIWSIWLAVCRQIA
jgi:hypothetical protein